MLFRSGSDPCDRDVPNELYHGALAAYLAVNAQLSRFFNIQLFEIRRFKGSTGHPVKRDRLIRAGGSKI